MGLSHPSSKADGSCRTSNSCAIWCVTPSYLCTPSWPRALLAQFGTSHGRRSCSTPRSLCADSSRDGSREENLLKFACYIYMWELWYITATRLNLEGEWKVDQRQ